MSRIGKQPITIPQGVTCTMQGNTVTVKGPKGTLNFTPASGVTAKVEGGKLQLSADTANTQTKANFGTSRAVLNNMIVGVSTGFKRSLELNGVGYTAKVTGPTLVLTVGFSHEVKIAVPKEVKCVVNKNVIDLESADRELIGRLASTIRKSRPPEPYLGKGIKYTEETIRRKAGKTAKK